MPPTIYIIGTSRAFMAPFEIGSGETADAKEADEK